MIISPLQVAAIADIARPCEYVDDRTLAQRTPISRVTWQQWRSRGEGPPYYKIGRRCFYKWVEIEAWLEKHRTGAKS